MQASYLNPTDESAKQLFSKSIRGEVIMLNLLRFKEIANYSQFSEIAPKTPITGKEAYQIYINQTLPFLEKSGGEIMLLGKSEHFFIGPMEEKWDLVMIIKQKSLDSFLSFASDPQYQVVLGHREAAIVDSRLLPIEAISSLS
ncbi:DUF1330 domain-containing protein [Aliiglaciecola sp. 2_MG-2023]|uniref:DUF1330 domain-containing protein n=1 Tax=unclassified Aliiglaciecola TaxID=2593648 RepID=UPI0026E1DAAE|nr:MULTISPECIES: DUF1330 domain-containing protein [unclassified Aliiglaciecola]MDO6710141.1 DUF1330 domain-containing protein [Aliiglaciecola sp. 2_MG-2023]MDO6751289.1 DUF1330 domain-containing protein [Aliiglaciecola sp. 1_MG-2023]